MNLPPSIARLSGSQQRAADPNRSVWVTASAGTGKTRVLASRIARLLLEGCKPHRVLALTFTNAAAAEMSDRVRRTLAAWTVMDEQTLLETLHDLTGERPTAERLGSARRCFARLLDDPIGLRTHTIHGFCQSLLRRFPVEADVPPHFSLIDERTREELLSQACDSVIARGEQADSLGQDDLETLADYADLDKALGLARALLAEGERLSSLPSEPTSLQRAYDRLLGLEPGTTQAALIADACAEGSFDRSGLIRAAEVMQTGSARYSARGQLILTWLSANESQRQATFAAYAAEFDYKDQTLLTKPMLKEWPSALDVVVAERARTRAVVAQLNAISIGNVGAALSRFARAVHGAYSRLKRQRAYLDYDDLITEATALLTRAEAKAWVLYKLDGGLDHILVDEAQDNSRAQWHIFRALAEELVGGLGVDGHRLSNGRSLFVVGDPKQSIYRFQGAAPDAFQETRTWIEHQLADAPPATRLEGVDLTTSFRSAEPILDFVDEVLGDEAMPDGAFPILSPHRAHNPDSKPGLVEIWPLVRQDTKPKPEPWPLPTGYDLTERAEERLAAGVAGQIFDLTRDPSAPVSAQDILVLVKKRSAFVTSLIGELKNKGIPVEGADRLSITNELAVKDLLVLGDFLLQRDDDLALATILRGPLICLDETSLFDLAYDRGALRLWDRLVQSAETDEKLAKIHAYLARHLADVDFATPFELFSAILSKPCPADATSGRRALATRLGRPINDPVDELLSQALSFEANHPPLLQAFLHWLRLTDEPLKRAAAEEPFGVRVMTIHGAKGLEADTVILADIDSRPPNEDVLYWFDLPDSKLSLPLWRPAEKLSCALLDQRHKERKVADQAEEMRLLYVALTRAEHRLYVCGTGPADAEKDKPARWYHYCERAMGRLTPTRTQVFDSTDVESWTGQSIRYALRETAFVRHDHGESEPTAPDSAHWSRQAAPFMQTRQAVRPSHWDAGDSEPAVFSPVGKDGQDRFRRGLIIHSLLEHLPAVTPADRWEIGRQFLNRPIHGLDAGQAQEYLAEAITVIEDPEFGAIFTKEALVEAPIIGQIGNRTINGQIDRMVIGDHHILIVDFKTNRPPPTDVEQTAPVYLRQMASYQAVLRQIFPDLPVKCALLWTVEPRLMPLPDNILDNVLGQSGS